MALDPTARMSNVKDSLKKFVVDSLHTTEGIHVSFDRFVDAEELLKTSPPTVNRWVTMIIGDVDRDVMGRVNVDFFCCTRQDSEGFRLAQLSDVVMGHLTDITVTDTMKRIPFYRSREQGAWTLLGQLLVAQVIESGEMDAPDKSKFKILTAIIRWSAKV